MDSDGAQRLAFWQLATTTALLLSFAGFAAFELGRVRPKNGAAVVGAKLAGALVGAVVFAVVGGPIMFGKWPIDPFQLAFGGVMAMTAASIPTGAVAERMSFRAQLVLIGLGGGLVFPLLARWAWIGWLGQRDLIDYGGATFVHAFAGAAALGAIAVVGARKGRFARSGDPQPIPIASAALVAAGVVTIWVGWIGWIGWLGVYVKDDPMIAGHALLASGLAASAGGLVGFLGGAIRARRAQLDVAARGVIAGLVGASSVYPIAGAPLAIGAGAAAAVVMILIDALLLRLRLDDATGIVGMHLGGGIVGALAGGFVTDGVLNRKGDLVVQFEALAICAAIGGALGVLAPLVTQIFMRIRVSADEEADGLDAAIHGALAEGEAVAQPVDIKFEPVAPNPFEAFAEVAHLAVDSEGNIGAGNPAACAIFAYAERELPKLNVFTLFSTPRGKAQIDAPGLQKLVGASREMVGLRRTGEEFHMEVSAQRGDDGSLQLALRDITKRKHAEEGLDRALDEIQRRLERELDAASVTVPEPGEPPPPGCEVSIHRDRARFLGTYLSAESITLFIGDVIDARSSSLLGDDEGFGANDYTHGLILGDAAYSPARQLRNLAEVMNRIILETGKGEILAPFAFAHVNLASGDMTYLNAGYAAPVVVRAQGKVQQLVGAGSPLGAQNNPVLVTRDLRLDVGDLVALMTDGITDAYSRSRKPFSARDLRRLVSHAAEAAALKDQILDRAHLVARDRADEAHHSVLVFRRAAVHTTSRRRELPGAA